MRMLGRYKHNSDRDIPAGNWILTEDQQGLVTMDQYPTAHAARCAFDHLPDSGGPGERTAPSPRLGRPAAGTRSGWTRLRPLTAIGRPRTNQH
jgi:hypothetical protein